MSPFAENEASTAERKTEAILCWSHCEVAQLFLEADSNVLSPSILVWEEMKIHSLNTILNFLIVKK